MYGIIYKATNKINGKVYIGQTTRSLKVRMREHRTDGKTLKFNTYFYKAINKYGADSFTFEEIDQANSREELNEKEMYWIEFYDSFKNGYNSSLGGEGFSLWTDEQIEQGIRKIMSDLDIEHFPTQKQMLEQNKSLSSTIGRRYGSKYWSKILGVELKQGETVDWDDELIEREIIRISKEYLDGKTMPTVKYLFEVTNNYKLVSAISKGLGFSGWANKLNLKLKDSDSNTGILGQFAVMEMLESMNVDATMLKLKDECNLLINNNIRVFVCSANPNYRRNSRIHRFKLKSKEDSDINILCAYGEDGKVENYFIMPHSEISHLKNTLDIGTSGRYYVFANKWETINELKHQ